MNVGKFLRKIVLLRPLLKLFGVKDHTVVAKVGEGLTVIEGMVNDGSPDETLKPKTGDEGIVLLFAMVIILMFLPVIAMIADALSY